MKIHVDVNATKKDYFNFQKHHTIKYAWVYVLFLVLIALLAAVLIKSYNETGNLNQLYLIFEIIASVSFIFVLINNIRKLLKAAQKEDKKPTFSYTFTKGGVHCDSNGKSFDLAWTNVYKVSEIKEMFLVYINSESALIIPKRCFTSQSDIDEFSQNLLFKAKKNIRKVKKKGIF